MEHGGRNLRYLNEEEPERENKVLGEERYVLSREEKIIWMFTDRGWSTRERYIAALKSLHKAGVHHGDIRPDNILFNRERKVIIDFDCAVYRRSDLNYEKNRNEIRRLQAVFDGDYVDGIWVS